MADRDPLREKKVRTTIDIPQSLWERVRLTVKDRGAKSQNTLIIQAIESYIQQLEESRIDAEFAQMRDDERYRTLNLKMAEEFSYSDWEAFQIEERKP